MERGRADLAMAKLQDITRRTPNHSGAWKLLGFACHEEQLEPEAVVALTRAAALDPGDAATAMALAQSSLLAGLPALEPFRRVLQLQPDDLNAQRGYALALATEQQSDAAETVLMSRLKQHPDWLAGHKLLARLRFTGGDSEHFADSFSAACEAQPANLALRMEWFRSVAQTRDWSAAGRIIDQGERIFGTHPQLQLARLFIASESGDELKAAQLFAATASIDDVMRDMALVRYSLRKGDLDIAEATARPRIATPAENVFWPYLALIWRLQGIPQAAQWLDGSPPHVAAVDLQFADGELSRLADLLRKLHTARSPFAEQSVRGGTQTDQNLFLRHEPILRALKSRIQAAVRTYVEQLPSPIPGHPLLGVERGDLRRGRIHFSGSWSVRLQAQGFNVSHTHPLGWISSAFYVALPPATSMGAAPAGWLQFGTPPAELKLALSPTAQQEPKAGRLVLFPSTMWHSTVPFNDGERLVVAFDVRAPQSALAPSITAASNRAV